MFSRLPLLFSTIAVHHTTSQKNIVILGAFAMPAKLTRYRQSEFRLKTRNLAWFLQMKIDFIA